MSTKTRENVIKKNILGFIEALLINIYKIINGILIVIFIMLTILFGLIAIPIAGAIIVSYIIIAYFLMKRKSRGLKGTRKTETFERKRYCVFDGSRIPLEAKHCPGCGILQPTSGEEKMCKNCRSMIPFVAYFCPVCGAFQPRKS